MIDVPLPQLNGQRPEDNEPVFVIPELPNGSGEGRSPWSRPPSEADE